MIPPASGLAGSIGSLIPWKSLSRETGVRAEGITQHTTLSLAPAFKPGVLRPTAHHRRCHDLFSNPKAQTGRTCGTHSTTPGLERFVMRRKKIRPAPGSVYLKGGIISTNMRCLRHQDWQVQLVLLYLGRACLAAAGV